MRCLFVFMDDGEEPPRTIRYVRTRLRNRTVFTHGVRANRGLHTRRRARQTWLQVAR